MVGEQLHHDPPERAVVLDAGVLPVRVLLGVLVRRVGGDLGGDLHRDHPVDLVQVLPLDVPEQLVERPDDVAQPVEFRLGLAAPGAWAPGPISPPNSHRQRMAGSSLTRSRRSGRLSPPRPSIGVGRGVSSET